jgi:hypothetical protein
MPARTPLVIGGDGLPQQLQAADTLASGLRIEKYTGTVAGGAGAAAVTFSPAFKSAPVAFFVESWSGNQMISGQVTATTATGCTVQAMISQGTLLLNTAPFATAPNGTVVNVIAIGA